MAKNPNKIRAKRVASDYVIDIIMIVTIVLVLVLTLYPFLNSLAISLNDSNDTTLGGLTIYPRKFTWRNYELVFTNQKIWMAYFITIARTVIGTVGGVLITGMLAFAIFQNEPRRQKSFTQCCVLSPMYFGAASCRPTLDPQSRSQEQLPRVHHPGTRQPVEHDPHAQLLPVSAGSA